MAIFSRFKTYSLDMFRADIIAGLIVAIVALPLAIGFAIASGVNPTMGVYAAIIGGFVAGILGGSEFQVSGPTGAMVVVVLSVVARFGIDGLIIATFLAGIILVLLGAFKFGKVIEYIPSPVIVGFTAGIATIIGFGQLNNFFGINPLYKEGAGFLAKTFGSLASLAQANIPATLLGVLSVCILIFSRNYLKRIPGSILAVITTTLLVLFFPTYFHVRLVQDIGMIPTSLPLPHLPHLSLSIIHSVLPGALLIAALSAIESLLSAVVADGMTDTKHRPNKELIGQGFANIASSFFGGLPITGAIARTATNIRSGAKSRIASVAHALFLLIIVLLAARYAGLIPIPSIAAILMFVAYNMVEWERIGRILKTPLSDVAVMLTTFFLTVLVDLTVAIEVGLILAAILFMKRMSDLYSIESLEGGGSGAYASFSHPDISIYTVNGPLFFGAASRIDQAIGSLPGGHKPIKIIRMKHVPVIDATGLNFLIGTSNKHKKMGGMVLFSSVQPNVLKIIKEAELEKELGDNHFFPTTRHALAFAIRESHKRRGLSEDMQESELAKYELRAIDIEDATQDVTLKDTDPIKDILDSVGLTTMARVGTKTVKHTLEQSRVGTKKLRAVTRKKIIYKKKHLRLPKR